MIDDSVDIRTLLSTLDPKARDDLRRVLIRDQGDRICKLFSWPPDVRGRFDSAPRPQPEHFADAPDQACARDEDN